MKYTLIRWLSPLFLIAALGLNSFGADPVDEIKRGVSGNDLPAEKSERVPAGQYALAGLATIIILVILCKPSRKGYST
jgi:hypothetical protein